jgi:thioredoxin-dependent peroxiredoxin
VGRTVAEGDKAPDFELKAQDGRTVSLHDFMGKSSVVVYFYPKDFTVGCTAEAKAFSENYDEVLKMGAEVMGVSSDNQETHGRFAESCHVRFPLLSDEGGKVREAYGVKTSFGFIPGRVTFVIDKNGIVRRIFSSQLNPARHVSEAVQALKDIGS